MRIRFKTEPDDEDALREERLRAKQMAQAGLRRQMEIFCSFCSTYILSENFDEVEKVPFVGVLLDIQITGVLRLIEKYMKLHDGGIYKLTYTINAYLSVIIETVTYWKGDVLKIYGDRCLNLWKLQPNESLFEVLHIVVLCAGIIKSELSEFNTFISHALDMKITIASGNIYGTCHGTDKKSMIFRGPPMEEIHQLASVVKPGEILISAKAWSYMVKHRYHVEIVNDTTVKLLNKAIAYHSNEREMNRAFSINELELRGINHAHNAFMEVLHKYRENNPTETAINLTRSFANQLPRREAITDALRTCQLQSIRPFVCHTVEKHIDEHQPVEYLTELSTVTLRMTCIKPNAIESMSDSFINFVYTEVNKSIANTSAFIYQFEVTTEIKIVVICGVDDIRRDKASKSALNMGYQMNQYFQDIPGIESTSVGIFQGYLYFGVLGHPFRREYVVLGSALNRGFKLMERNKDKVICDYKTFKFSKVPSYFFRCIRKRRCNTDFDSGQLLEYSERIDQGQWQFGDEFKRVSEILGRNVELSHVLNVIQSNSPKSEGIAFEGVQNIGKRDFLAFIVREVSKTKRFVTVSLALHNSYSTPFATVRHIYQQVYMMHSSTYADMPEFYRVPSELIDRHQFAYDEDGDLKSSRCRIYDHFKQLFAFGKDCVPVIIIANIEFIDKPSWDVLEQLMNACKMRFFVSADFSAGECKLKSRLLGNKHLKWIHLQPLSDHWIHTIACNYIGVAALAQKISVLITKACNGLPGFVQTCLTYLTNCHQYMLASMCKEDLTPDFITIDKRIFDRLPKEIVVLIPGTSDDIEEDTIGRCSIDAITREFYFSLPAFDQVVLQASSILGSLFSRNLLEIVMHNPPEAKLRLSIKRMFEENVFECGSTYVNGLPLHFEKNRCRCYMSEEELASIADGERYMHCKLLHFKHRNLQTITYDLIPTNKKIDVHLQCTEVLENSVHSCPMCLRDPLNGYVIAPTYREVIEYCAGTDLKMSQCPAAEHNEELKDCIRRLVYHNQCLCIDTTSCAYKLPVRPLYDPRNCNCLDMLVFVYENLIIHSNCAQHLGKQILYCSIFGYLLILTKDVLFGIATLREALELCMVNVNSATCQVSTNYRKFSVGRISMMIASTLIQLRKINLAKIQMTLAMRQYNIPSVAFKFQHFQCFLRKSYLSNIRHAPQGLLRQTWMRWEIGMCFGICARIYAIEGKLMIARRCAKYSAWVLSQMNERIPMLFEVYCNVIELYRYGLDKNVCEKMQKYVTKELLLNYCNNRGYYARHIMTLLTVEFELKVTSAKLDEAVTMCYRILDTSLKLFVYLSNCNVFIWLGLVFAYTMRIKEFVNIMRVIFGNIQDEDQMWFFANSLEVSLLTGYAHLPIEILLKEVDMIINQAPKNPKDWERNYLLSLVCLHKMKLGMYLHAERFKPVCIISDHNVHRPIVLRILLNIIEAELYDIYNHIQNGLSFSRIVQSVKQELKLAGRVVKTMPVFYPKLHCLHAWMYQLEGKRKKAKLELRKVEKYSRRQRNQYMKCFARQLRRNWNGSNHLISYRTRITIQLNEVMFLDEEQWAQVLIPYPTVNKRTN